MIIVRSDKTQPSSWLLLIHQLPPKPAYFRVKIWRRLQALGAVAIKGSVYALPANDQTQEDFEWLLQEIVAGDGEGSICEARFVDGLSDQEIEAMFSTARDRDYEAIAEDARTLMRKLVENASSAEGEATDLTTPAARLRKRMTEIAVIDFFGANGRETAEGLISALETQIKTASNVGTKDETRQDNAVDRLTGKTWVTRQGVHVDRIASAWLIKRFIDPEANFKFVASKSYVPAANELRFDMFEAEFTHEGDKCTFEVLLDRTGIGDVALTAIAEIVHDIDLKDDKFGREESTGIAHLIAGIAMAHRSDAERLSGGAVVFENLYEYFRKTRH
jgi:hypothetical protein